MAALMPIGGGVIIVSGGGGGEAGVRVGASVGTGVGMVVMGAQASWVISGPGDHLRLTMSEPDTTLAGSATLMAPLARKLTASV